MFRLPLFVCVGFAIASGLSRSDSAQFHACSYAAENVLVRDLVVIGGGASGAYGAIAMKDMGRSVVVVEKESHFGGHVNTYTDPTTGLALEYGVQAYDNDSITRDFFARFNVPLIPLHAASGAIIADFKTGQNVTPATGDTSLAAYAAQTNQYYPNPALGLHLPQPVPTDLLLPFGQFIKKYSLEDSAYTIWSLSGPDNNLLDQLTLYAIFGCNAAATPLLSGHRSSSVTTRNNSELFGKAEKELGSNSLLNSQVIAAKRTNDSVSLVVQTPTTKKLILASHVLFSAPIVLDNLTPFDLDSQEHRVFSQIYYTSWYTALVTDTGLKPGYFYTNAASNTPYNIPLQPYTFRIGASIVNTTFYAFYGAMTVLPEDKVKAIIAENIQTLSGKSTTPRFLAFASHTPFRQQVSAKAIANGFYNQLNALQGYRGMHYTGHAMDASGSSSLFNFTRNLLPNINEAIAASKLSSESGQCGYR
ncbi:hypothetical protein OIDMADRAFT_131121 [Oidiodendron maius Zn]|uniref:Amine oxidase domain-containing protein n=1 Tax=Oidiodendron maius (strain Zn) TaxID=913774 RepID=A0A0C3H0U9_OIDMZ|nr:hypothetical protein OIDMADRAFT_131121 [Oidiodendron maius Zn]